MTIEEMKQRKKELGYTCARLSELSGVPLSTVQKIFSGATPSPRYGTLLSLESLLAPDSAQDTAAHSGRAIPQVSTDAAYRTMPPRTASGKTSTSSASQTAPGHDFASQNYSFSTEELTSAGMIGESTSSYQTKQQGDYTLTDYYQIPEERRAELIDGVIYDMTTPACDHQLIAGLIYAKLLAYVSAHKGTCLPMVSPVDVQLDCDQKTMVEPDVLVICDRSRVIRRCVYGAPDFVVEILSPFTRKKDVTIKLNKYMNAGVREYWVIDPIQRKVLVYDFFAEIYPVIYGFDAKIPVAIWDGDCVIDFQEVYDYIHFLYEKDPNPPQ